ncbi:MAG: nuclear transport factor 2 family protein [Candidatus Acidiferrales bacterium]
MKRSLLLTVVLAIAAWAGLRSAAAPSPDSGKDQLLAAREAVWRDWFAGDQAALEREVPPETIAISASETAWHNQKEILQSAADFHTSGGKLTRLEFPRTEIQRFGDVAMLYSQYVLETESNGKRSEESGRVTEIFVWRDGHWVNPGWHTDAVK